MKTTYRKSWPGNLFQFPDFDPFFSVKWGHLTTRALYLHYFSYITEPKVGDNCCGSALVFYVRMTHILRNIDLDWY